MAESYQLRGGGCGSCLRTSTPWDLGQRQGVALTLVLPRFNAVLFVMTLILFTNFNVYNYVNAQNNKEREQKKLEIEDRTGRKKEMNKKHVASINSIIDAFNFYANTCYTCY